MTKWPSETRTFRTFDGLRWRHADEGECFERKRHDILDSPTLNYHTKVPNRETERHSLSSSSTEVSADRIASELKGNTLRVYWFVMNASNQTVGVREAQRALNFSSPTLALYHLDKLRDLGLVSRDSGGYKLIKEVKVDVLKQFMKLPGQFFVPRFSLYAVLFTVLTIYYALNLVTIDFFAFFGLLFGGLGSAIFWFEAIKTWRQRP